MIRMNLIAVAEKSTVGNVSQHLHVTNVADVERQHKKKYLTVALAAVLAVVAFSCYLSVNGVPAVLALHPSLFTLHFPPCSAT